MTAGAGGQGHGRRLLDALAPEAERRGLNTLASRIVTSNDASRAGHRATGVVEVGVQRRHGRRDGEWKDSVLVERLLGEAADDGSWRLAVTYAQPMAHGHSHGLVDASITRSREGVRTVALALVVLGLGQRRAAGRPHPQRR